ncbi:hypothetical protein LJC14_04525 [Treponema sp. OttesenSCG-928-L16]|nr:hypothetical protein [Treponema sp. OttesenSCG-928-L16]
MRKYLLIFIISITILAAFGLIAYHFFEVYPTKRYARPSREARSNSYLALDRWLQQSGHPVRLRSQGNAVMLTGGNEKTALVQSTLFDWSGDGSYDSLVSWVEGGGSLIVAVDSPWYEDIDGNLTAFLEKLGVHAEKDFRIPSLDEVRDAAEDDSETAGSEEAGGTEAENETEPKPETEAETEAEDGAGSREAEDPAEERPFPAFDRYTAFSADPEIQGVETLEDKNAVVRLLKLPMGKGEFIFTGDIVFMRSSMLDDEENARLAWALTGARDTEKTGILFIRGREPVQSLFGKLADRGNPLPLLVSVLVLVLAGFWAVIPAFGRLSEGDRLPGKALKERFLAEAWFLRKNDALGTYIEAYAKAVRQKLRRREAFVEDDQVAVRLAEICAMDLETVESALKTEKHIRGRDFMKQIENLETILERL